MTLIERCEALSAEMTSLERARQTAHLRAAVATRLQEWKEKRDEISELCGALGWLGVTTTVDVVVSPLLLEIQSRATAIRDKLTTVEEIENLNRNAQWTRLHKFVDEKIARLESLLEAEWRAKVDAVGAFQSPEVLGSQLPRTPQNVAALKDYDNAYRQFRAVAVLARPRAPDDITRLSSCAEQVGKMFAAFDFAVPADVDNFFRAVASGGAPLELLTETVLRWLDTAGQKHQYVIRAKVT
jgi:hypothetical protein